MRMYAVFNSGQHRAGSAQNLLFTKRHGRRSDVEPQQVGSLVEPGWKGGKGGRRQLIGERPTVRL